MEKQRYALIGYPLIHSISPFIHKQLFSLSNIDAEYKLLQIEPEKLLENMNILNHLNGYNITIPHKIDIIHYLDKTDEMSKSIGAVNTVANNRQSCGYNTDIVGFKRAIEINGMSLKKRVAILGCGGTARTVSYAALKAGCSITYIIREKSFDKAKKLTRDLSVCDTEIFTMNQVQGEFDLLINTTPVGMYPDNSLSADERILEKCKSFFDVIYNPIETASVKLAEKMGIKSTGGLDMLVMQAVEAHKIWYSGEFSKDDIKNLTDRCKGIINKDFGDKYE